MRSTFTVIIDKDLFLIGIKRTIIRQSVKIQSINAMSADVETEHTSIRCVSQMANNSFECGRSTETGCTKTNGCNKNKHNGSGADDNHEWLPANGTRYKTF